MLPYADTHPGLYTVTEPLPYRLLRTAAVHLIRHPVEQILSAYRYHMDQTEEFWTQEWGRCNFCTERDWQFMFSRCGFSCSYRELLHSVNEADGMVLEFHNQRLTVDTMLANMHEWKTDANVLSISLGQFRTNFDGTIRCI